MKIKILIFIICLALDGLAIYIFGNVFNIYTITTSFMFFVSVMWMFTHHNDEPFCCIDFANWIPLHYQPVAPNKGEWVKYGGDGKVYKTQDLLNIYISEKNTITK